MHMRCQSLEIPDFTTHKTELGLRSFQNAARKEQLPDSIEPAFAFALPWEFKADMLAAYYNLRPPV